MVWPLAAALLAACAAGTGAGSSTGAHGGGGKPNVLYVVVDDLRPELPSYGQGHIIAPALERLAARSVVFERAYCNQPVCSPSRNSFLSGRRPAHTKIWNFMSDFRAVGPNWTTLPSQFKAHGYLTLGTGKIYHEGCPANGDGNKSWSQLVPVQFGCAKGGASGGEANATGFYCDPDTPACSVAGTAETPNPRCARVAAAAKRHPAGCFLCFSLPLLSTLPHSCSSPCGPRTSAAKRAKQTRVEGLGRDSHVRGGGARGRAWPRFTCTWWGCGRWCGIDLPMNTTNTTFADVTTLLDATDKLHYAARNKDATGQPWYAAKLTPKKNPLCCTRTFQTQPQ